MSVLHSGIPRIRSLAIAALAVLAGSPATVAEPRSDTPDGEELVAGALDQWRGNTSESRIEVVIHRPDWERTLSMRLWTAGKDRSLVRVLSPESEAGTGHLLMDGSMWTFSPDVDRVVRVPGSMMSQQWLSSDFTNNEIARSDSILEDYEPEVVDHWEEDGLRHYELRLEPHEEAPVVWGHQELVIREDHILMRQAFHDQGGDQVKTLRTEEVGERGGRQVAVRQRMEPVDDDERWTEVTVEEAEYDLDLPDQVFSVANLRNPRF